MSNEKISIQELVDQIAQQAGTTKKRAEDFLKIFQSTIEEGLIKDGLVKVKGFGTFKLIWNEARKSVNVQTGEEYIIPGHNKVTFSPETNIKEQINNPNKPLASSVDKQGIDPIEKLNEQAEEIKGIISEIKDLNKAEDVKAVEIEKPTEVKVEPVPVPVETPIQHDYPNESIQHKALSEKHVLQEREIPIKPKRKVGKIILIVLLALLVLGAAGFYVEFKNTLVPEYKNKIVSNIKALYTNITTKQKEEPKAVEKPLPKVKAQEPASVDTLITLESPKVDTVKQAPDKVETPKPEAVKPPPPATKPKVSVFDEARTFNQTIATETIEKGSRLVLIAEKYYGHKDFWVYLYEANKSQMKSPGAVSIGMKIKVPKLNPALIDVNNPACLKYAKSLEEKYLK